MRYVIPITAVLVLIMVCNVSAATDPPAGAMNVDFGEGGWGYEDGWKHFDVGYVPQDGETYTWDGITFKLKVIGNNPQFRDGTWVMEPEYDAVTADLIGTANPHEGDTTEYGMHIEGLTVGQEYTFISYHNLESSWMGYQTPTAGLIGMGGSDFGTMAPGGADSWANILQLQVSWTAVESTADLDWTSPGNNDPWICGFTLVPEPATLALLGMGCLFLRRRRG